MGKSTLAIAAGHALKPRMHGIWLIQAATADSLRASLEGLAHRLGLPPAPSPDRSVMARATLQALEDRKHEGWLLIYDNADDPVMVGAWLPQDAPHIRTIITSRSATWPAEERLDLGRMSPAESLAMLRAGLPGRGRENLAAIADRLDHWPLALTAAIGFLSVHGGTTVAEYLAAYDVKRAELLKLDWNGVAYADPDRPETLSVAAAMRLTTDQLAADDRDLLSVLAFLNPDDLWPEMVAKGAASEVREPFDESTFPGFLTRAGQDAALVTQGMDRLRAVSLVFDRDGSAQMHRLFAELWRAGLGDAAPWSTAAARVVNSQLPYDNDSEVNWPSYTRLTGHARALLAAGADSLAAARLFAQIGGFLYHRGAAPDDIALPQAAADIDARLDPGCESHAASLNNLSQFQRLANALPAALTTLELVRAIKAALPDIGPDHPSYAITLNNIAGVHRAMGDHAAAELQFQDALRIDTAALGAEHPNTIIRHRNLGALYGEWAQTAPPDQAQDLRQKEAAAKALALDLSLRVNGLRHQDTARDRNNAAIRLAQAVDMPAAWDQMRMAAAIRLDMLPQHPWAMESLRAYRTLALRTRQPAKTLLPALVAEARAQRAAHIAWGKAKLTELLRAQDIDGALSQETVNALAQAIAARQAAMQAERKPIEAYAWPMQQLQNALHAASLPPDLPAEFEANAAQMLAALASAGNRPDNGGERIAP